MENDEYLNNKIKRAHRKMRNSLNKLTRVSGLEIIKCWKFGTDIPLKLCRSIYYEILKFSNNTLRRLECDILYIASNNNHDNKDNIDFESKYNDNNNEWKEIDDEIPDKFEIIQMDKMNEIVLHCYPSKMQQALYDSIIKTPNIENIKFILHYPYNRDLNEDDEEFHHPIFQSVLKTLYFLTNPHSTKTINFQFNYDKEAFLFMNSVTREVCYFIYCLLINNG